MFAWIHTFQISLYALSDFVFFAWITLLISFPMVGIICGPVLLLWTFFRGELEMTINFPLLFSLGFLVWSSSYRSTSFLRCDLLLVIDNAYRSALWLVHFTRILLQWSFSIVCLSVDSSLYVYVILSVSRSKPEKKNVPLTPELISNGTFENLRSVDIFISTIDCNFILAFIQYFMLEVFLVYWVWVYSTLIFLGTSHLCSVVSLLLCF